MAQNSNKKQVEQITDMEVDFAQWYTDVCKKPNSLTIPPSRACSSTALCYAIWENIQAELDKKFKETGHENVYLPMLILRACCRRRRTTWRALPPSAPG